MHKYIILFALQISANLSAQLIYDSSEQAKFALQEIHKEVDSIMNHAMAQKAFPGAQLLVAKKGRIIFHKTYGYHTYDTIQKVSLNDIYDIASVTKIMGPLPILMKLYEEGKIDLDAPFSNYWKSWKNRDDKKNLTLRELLSHQAGMLPYIPFLKKVMQKEKWKNRFIKTQRQPHYTNQVYDGIYVRNTFHKKMFRVIKRSKVSSEKTYVYSGVASLMYPTLIEQLTNVKYSIYLENNFFKKLDCDVLGYNPLSRNLNDLIVPTEKDTVFRKGLIKGFVHDENAALLGGISGNAGLFATAFDLAKFMQMLLQKGTYNGMRFFEPETIEEFTKVQFSENNNRRGLGFDKPLLNNTDLGIEDSYPAPEVSPTSFGHSGFTGSFVWADPEYDLVFIFLSNRVYPDRNHRNIYNLNIRPKLQQVFYTSLFSKK